jgi:hypothetical protein
MYSFHIFFNLWANHRADSAKVEPRDIARFFVTTFRVSQSQRSDVWRVVEVSSVSQP